MEKESPETETISFNEAMQQMNVSIATIRNWVKTGLLDSPQKRQITLESLQRVQKEIIGQQKLTSRANKQNKPQHDHHQLSICVKQWMETINGERIGERYENSLSDSFRNKEGVYYTPMSVTQDMMQEISSNNIDNALFLDPCCGSGNFLIAAIEMGFKPENIYGFDLDANGIAIAKKRIKELCGYETQNIIQGNFLEKAISIEEKFDYIYTNPPWGKKLPTKERLRYSTIYNAGKSVDTSSLFLLASLKALKENGKLGFLLPDAFYNIGTFEDVRIAVLNKQIERLVDYGKVFKGIMTKAQAIILSKSTPPVNHIINCQIEGKEHQRTYKSFKINPKSILNFEATQSEAEVIQHLYSLPHLTLTNNAQWGLGIVTGNNEQFCTHEPKNGYIPVYRGSDITPNGLKQSTCFIPDNMTLYQQVAPEHLYLANEKLIYKFISSKLCFICDTQQRYILNSANFLIPSSTLPLDGEQLCELLNSKVLNWLFRKLFRTHKILRGDLEQLPLFVNYFQTHLFFDESSFCRHLGIAPTSDGSFRII